jgi:hypothetical protein
MEVQAGNFLLVIAVSLVCIIAPIIAGVIAFVLANSQSADNAV